MNKRHETNEVEYTILMAEYLLVSRMFCAEQKDSLKKINLSRILIYKEQSYLFFQMFPGLPLWVKIIRRQPSPPSVDQFFLYQ